MHDRGLDPRMSWPLDGYLDERRCRQTIEPVRTIPGCGWSRPTRGQHRAHLGTRDPEFGGLRSGEDTVLSGRKLSNGAPDGALPWRRTPDDGLRHPAAPRTGPRVRARRPSGDQFASGRVRRRGGRHGGSPARRARCLHPTRTSDSSWYSSSTLTAQTSWLGAVDDVLDGEHRGVHRVVLVVVLVHAVAARPGTRWMRARPARPAARRRWPCSARRRSGTPSACARRSRPRCRSSLHQARASSSSRLASSMSSSSGDVHIVVALEHEVLEAEAGAPVLDHVRRPRPEVLDAHRP